jgi:hypothetical protein
VRCISDAARNPQSLRNSHPSLTHEKQAAELRSAYHVSGTLPRLWTKLSNDRTEALRLWAQREGVREDDSTKLFSVVARRYVREVFPTKSVQTRRDNDKELANLLKVFAHMPIDAIAPMHIREYMDIRGQVAKVRANREKALFSHLFNKAREWGYTAIAN